MAFLENVLRSIFVRFVVSPLTQPQIPESSGQERRLYPPRSTTWGLDRPRHTRSFLRDDGVPGPSAPARRAGNDRQSRGERCLPQVAPLPVPRGLLACTATPAPRRRRHERRSGR